MIIDEAADPSWPRLSAMREDISRQALLHPTARLELIGYVARPDEDLRWTPLA
jgi:hypothetical protein